MRNFGLISLFASIFLLSACYQTECPETKDRLLERFTKGSVSFDTDLVSPAPEGAAEGDLQAILDSTPARCVSLEAEFVNSAINGVEGEACALVGTACQNDPGQTCVRATTSTANNNEFACRQTCSGADDDTCPTGTACIEFDDDGNGVINNNDAGFRCDNPNLGVCQNILRTLGEPRCVECDEMELLICECRSGASLFQCLASYVGQEAIRDQIAAETCEEANTSLDENGQPVLSQDGFDECFEDLSEPNSREERNACFGVQANIARLNDNLTPDCSRYAFVQNNGELCGSADECIGGRCVLVDSTEFDANGNPQDPATKQVCSSDCGQVVDGNVVADLDACESGTSFCSDRLVDRAGNAVAPACIQFDDPNLTFAPDFTTSCDVTNANSCGVGICRVMDVPGSANPEPRCTFPCDSDDNERCGPNAVCDVNNGFCVPSL